MNICRNSLDLFTFGIWEGPYEAAADVLRAVDMWIEREVPPLERVYVCPLCGYVVHRPRGVILRPRCPLHREMVWYVPQLVKDSKLYEWLKDQLARKLVVLEVLAKWYAGKPPDAWRLYAPPVVELVFDSGDPTVFRYAWWRNMFEAYLHRLDQERHREVLSYLRRAAVDYFHREVCVEINTQHATAVPDGAVYDEERGVYRIVVKPL